jgi:hypothetical protein
MNNVDNKLLLKNQTMLNRLVYIQNGDSPYWELEHDTAASRCRIFFRSNNGQWQRDSLVPFLQAWETFRIMRYSKHIFQGDNKESKVQEV